MTRQDTTSSSNKPMRPASTEPWFGHPKGVFLVSSTEMWERFSYFGLSTLLVLFLVAPVADGGFAWTNSEAVKLYGLYSGLAFSVPAIGGWIASRYWGERKSIVIGGLLIVLGHILIGMPGFIPWFIEFQTGVAADQLLAQTGLSMGAFSITPETAAALLQAASAAENSNPLDTFALLEIAYLSKGWGLMSGLGFVMAGTAFLKGPISSIVGKLYGSEDTRREAGFTLFMMGIWMGALLAEFVVGVIGEHLGWHAGLAIAGLGMAIGLTNYLIHQEAFLGDVGKACDMGQAVAEGRSGLYFSIEERRKLYGLGFMAVFTVIFSAAYNQYGGVWNLLIFNSVDRSVGGFIVPAAWFIAVTTVGFILLAPLATRFYAWCASKGYELDIVQKQALGLLAIAIGYLILLVPSWQHVEGPDSMLNAGWIIAAYLFFAIGDVFIWPPQIAAVSKYAPERYQAFIIGLWYVTYGLGGIIAGYAGPYAYSEGLVIFSGAILAVCLSGVVGLLLLKSQINKYLEG